MSLKAKYEQLLSFARELGMRNLLSDEKDGYLQITGELYTPYEKNIFWDKLKEIAGQNPTDIKADIKVSEEKIYHIHKVEKGETLSKISKKYYGDANKYQEIFKANTDKLKNPDLIQIGQELVIPKI